MARLLYITANPKSHEDSVGYKVGQAFLRSYRETNPDDEIKEIDLYRERFQTVDSVVIDAWTKIKQHNASLSDLTPLEQEKVNAIYGVADMFMQADKYVFVAPMWNWSLLPRLKAFIDSFVIVGKTFSYTATGTVGHLNNKKAIHVQVSAGVYSHGPKTGMDHSHPYLKMILGIVGVTDVEALFVEGHGRSPEKAKEIISAGIIHAAKLGATF